MKLVQPRTESPPSLPELEAIAAGLDFAGVAAWIVDSHLRVVTGNRACHAFIPVSFSVEDGRLRTVNDNQQLLLDRILMNALGRFALPSPGAVLLTGEDGQRLVITASPLDVAEDRYALLLLRALDINAAPIDNAGLLRQFFGFTPAECVFAAHLLTGVPIATIALTMKISILTARERLKTLFHKTGTRRQAELVLLLDRLQRAH